MRLGFHGATSMTSDLDTDVRATAHAGLKALEMWASKIDKYLADHSLDDPSILSRAPSAADKADLKYNA